MTDHGSLTPDRTVSALLDQPRTLQFPNGRFSKSAIDSVILKEIFAINAASGQRLTSTIVQRLRSGTSLPAWIGAVFEFGMRLLTVRAVL